MIKCSLNPSIPSTLLPKSLFPTFGRSKANERPISMESQAIHGSRSSESPLLSSSLSMPEAAATTAMLLGREEDQIGNLRSSPSFYGEQREKGSVLSRSLSDTSDSNCNGSLCQQMRRRIARDKPFSSLCSRQRSFSRDVGHAAAETYLLTRLSFKLLRCLGIGYRWISKLLALGFYAMLLMPGFLQVGYYYFFSKQVRRSMVYGDQPRNRLDLYLPTNSDGLKPVVAFVTGGAWIIGYKAWGSLLGKQLSERGIVVACIDYRNFPQGTISDMVEDSSQGISWVCSNISNYGGDPKRIYLMGQSAGAHIAACALLEQAIKESWGKENVSWSVSQIKAYFGLSGGYNLLNLVDHFHKRGLYRSIFLSIMEGEKSLPQFSPEIVVQDPSIRKAVFLLPPIILFHGTADYSIPSNASVNFADALKSAGAQAESILFEGKTHTDLFLQDPLRGGRDELFENLIAFIYSGNTEALPKDVSVPRKRRLVPEFMLQLARKISPF